MTIRLTPDQEALVQKAVTSGLVATPEEFVAEALRNQADELDRQSQLDDWLRTEVTAGHREYLNDPSTGKTLAETRAELLGG